MAGLSVSDLVNVTVSISPTAATQRNFGAGLIIGASDVIDTTERMRSYSSFDEVSADFGSTDPEYLAANLWFSQSPVPSLLYIGRWAKTATAGRLNGGVLSTAAQALTNFTSVTDGSMVISIDGTAKTISALSLASATSLAGVAALITTALSSAATCTWDSSNSRFVIESATTGASSSVSYATDYTSGTSLGTLLGLKSGTASAPVAGIASEAPLAAVTALATLSTDWYGCIIADASVTDAQHEAIAAYVEALSVTRIYGITTQTSAVLDGSSTTDLASILSAAGYTRTFIQYSSSSPYAAASMMARAFTVDFTANNSTITLMWKTEPGVTYELLTETQAATLKSKHCNAYVRYNNDTAIIQHGVMCSGLWFDVRHGTDWLQNNVQTDVFNLLYQSTTKIPQTDAGVHKIVTAVESALADGVTNGLIAPGVWNNPLEFGTLHEGDTLTAGYYVYAPQVSSQSQSVRETRVAPTIQCAIKLGGAVHSANVQINVNQ